MNGIPATCGARNALLIDLARIFGETAQKPAVQARNTEDFLQTIPFSNSKPKFDNEWTPVMLFPALALDLPVIPARPAGRFAKARIHGRFGV